MGRSNDLRRSGDRGQGRTPSGSRGRDARSGSGRRDASRDGRAGRDEGARRRSSSGERPTRSQGARSRAERDLARDLDYDLDLEPRRRSDRAQGTGRRVRSDDLPPMDRPQGPRGSDARGRRRGTSSERARKRAWQRRNRRILAACLVAVLVLVVVGVVSCVGGGSEDVDVAQTGGSGIIEATSIEVLDDALTEEQLAQIAAAEAAAEELAARIAELEAELADAVADLEDAGYDVGYIAMSVDGTDTIEWNADTAFYGASTIKGPFCLALVCTYGDEAVSSWSDTITTCLRDSNNDSYTTLRNAYSSTTLWDDWVEASDLGSYTAATNYAFYSARDLAKLWAEGAEWLLSDDENATWLAAILGDTLYSTVDDIAGADGTQTCSKAGWYYGGGEEYDTTADGGVVAYDGGTFVVAVMTSAPYDFDAVTSIMEPLVELWELTHAAESE